MASSVERLDLYAKIKPQEKTSEKKKKKLRLVYLYGLKITQAILYLNYFFLLPSLGLSEYDRYG